MTPEDRARFGEFCQSIADRLEQGAQEYGDTAKRRPLLELCREVNEELLDVCGWAFWMHQRIHLVQSCLEEIERRGPPRPEGY